VSTNIAKAVSIPTANFVYGFHRAFPSFSGFADLAHLAASRAISIILAKYGECISFVHLDSNANPRPGVKAVVEVALKLRPSKCSLKQTNVSNFDQLLHGKMLTLNRS
jgi:hypothetical protein